MSDELETTDERWSYVDKGKYVDLVQTFSSKDIQNLEESPTYTLLSTELTKNERDALKVYLLSLKEQIRAKLEDSLKSYVSNALTIKLLEVSVLNIVPQLNIIDINKILPLSLINGDQQLKAVTQGLTSKQNEISNDNVEEKYRYAQSKNVQSRLTAKMEADKELLENTDALIKILDLIP